MINQALILEQAAIIREESENFLFDTAYLKKKVSSTAVRGTPITTYADPIEIRCRLINRSGNDETPIASQFRAVQLTTNVALFRMQVPYDTDVDLEDVIIFNNDEFEIVHVPVKHSLMGAFVLYLLRKT